ncbi:MAG: PD-(D/E)XK nuclease family protein [Salibacteraceae bacterium]
METTFLQKLAKETIEKYPLEIDKVCFVFPSKRSGLFFKKELAKGLQKTFWSPGIITVDAFIEDLSGLTIIDPLEQLFELFEVHKELNIQPQLPFDRFIDVGKIILADFNDIDMALSDADALFSNVLEYRKLENWNPENGKGKLQDTYLDSFANLPQYYWAYQKRLLASKKAYQGLVYRNLQEQIKKGNSAAILKRLSKWNFINVAGLNALTPAERMLFDWLKKERGLKIYFESEDQMLSDYDQESGLFIREFYKKEGKDFKWSSNYLKNRPKSIETYSVNGNLAMARLVGDLFKNNERLTNRNETAIILADEGLLMPVLESLPPKVGEVNVTLGFPLGLTPFMSFTEQIFGMQTLASVRNGKRHFYFKDVMKLISNPILNSIIKDTNAFKKLREDLIKSNLVWIEESYFENKKLFPVQFAFFSIIFQDWKKKPLLGIEFLNDFLLHYQANVESSTQTEDVLLEQMYFFKKSIVKLQGYLNKITSGVSLEGIRRIFKHVVSIIQVPFSGEPLAGVQVLGLLETRLLSFKNVVFVSVNEGVIPSKGGFQSFLPFTLRNGYGIQTHQHRESIFAYHFYRILSQAENIHLVYDSSTTGIGSHEKSRFVRQIEQEWPEINKEIVFKNHVGVFQNNEIPDDDFIEKTPEVIQNIKNYLTHRGLSPSALNTFVESPIDFYYGNVIGIRQPNQVEEDLEHNTFGSIVHDCLERFYIPFEGKIMTPEMFRAQMLGLDGLIQEVFSNKIPNYGRGKHYLSFYSVEKYVKRFIQLDMDFITKNKEVVKMVKNEMKLNRKLLIDNVEFSFKGKADRIEERSGVSYIIDYKTGSVENKDLEVKSFEDIEDSKYKSKFVQLMMYAWLAKTNTGNNSIVSGIYTLRDSELNLLTAKVDKKGILHNEELDLFEEFLVNKVKEMLDPKIPFVRNPDYIFADF